MEGKYQVTYVNRLFGKKPYSFIVVNLKHKKLYFFIFISFFKLYFFKVYNWMSLSTDSITFFIPESISTDYFLQYGLFFLLLHTWKFLNECPTL